MHVVRLTERPDLAGRLFDFPRAWPQFMYQDPTSDLYYDDVVQTYPEHVLLALDAEEVVARAFSVPLAWDGDPATRVPDGGWDWVIRQALATRTGPTANRTTRTSRSPSTRCGPATTGSRPTRGCGCTSARAGGSSTPRRCP